MSAETQDSRCFYFPNVVQRAWIFAFKYTNFLKVPLGLMQPYRRHAAFLKYIYIYIYIYISQCVCMCLGSIFSSWHISLKITDKGFSVWIFIQIFLLENDMSQFCCCRQFINLSGVSVREFWVRVLLTIFDHCGECGYTYVGESWSYSVL